MTRLILVILVFLLSGCAQHVIMRHPQTGQTVDCTALSMASPNPIQQVVDERGCISGHQAAGYICATCR